VAPFILKIFKMAISVDTVYKTVLLILNKEQRGYMTPDEFNRIGTQVQRELFEKCFEDLNQQVRIPQTDMDYADRVAATDEKIAEFKTESDQSIVEKAIGVTNPISNTFTVPSELYKLGTVTYEPNALVYPEMQRLGRSEFYNIIKAPLTTPTKNFPVYLYEDNKCIVYPSDITNVNDIKMQYVKKPTDIRWGYYSGTLGQYIFDVNEYVATGLPVIEGFANGYLFESLTTDFAASGGLATYTGLDQNDARVTYTNSLGGTGTGSGMVFSLDLNSDGTILSLNVTSPGKGYLVGDRITLSDAFQTAAGGTNAVISIAESSLYSGTTFGHTNFGLQTSEQTELVLNVLLYAGIVIRDPSIVQVAQSELQQDKINEKS
jgi:hypothetical protein